MSELAVVSSRPARLKVLAAEGKRGATVALKLQEDPGKFLSSVQIGITLVGVLSGAFSGATLGERLGADAGRRRHQSRASPRRSASASWSSSSPICR
jgi:CBS domain containing-hemolysin-like protein